ncbi:MAG: hypothetical protein ACOH19_04105 [Rhodoglobus sp.]
MADEVEDEAEKPVGFVARLLDKVSTRHWILFGGAVLLALTGLFGGLATAENDEAELPVLAVGEEHMGPQFSVAVHDLQLMDVAPGYTFEPEDGNEYLVVTVTLTNNWVASTTDIGEAITIEGLELPTIDRTVLLSDSTALPQAHPRIPIDVALVWQVPRDTFTDGETVQVSIMEASLRTESDLLFGDYWYDPLPVAHVTVTAHRIAAWGDSE